VDDVTDKLDTVGTGPVVGGLNGVVGGGGSKEISFFFLVTLPVTGTEHVALEEE
jgi:hypothetical protein